MDIIANIGALFSTIKFFFSVFFSFYSQNFDNYEILGKILNPPNHKKDINIPLSSNKKGENKNIMEDVNNIDKLIDDDDFDKNKNEMEQQEYNINDEFGNGDGEENILGESSSNKVLSELHFYDYFLNNIYSKCCRKIKNQELINNANDIVYKYLSIDYLLYNQIKLENLFKDYKWNNPALNNIQNNKMINKLIIT